jgi:ubiquinone biosynthesis protein
MIRPALALRLFHINWVLLRHGLDEIILETHLFRPLRFLMYLTPWYWLRGPLAARAVRIRHALEELGPIFVKFGQVLSTRRDLLPDDIAEELAKLQDRVPPFPGAQARGIVEKALGRPVTALFGRFEEEPFASASIAQVHGARLHDGREVVVKVLRPAIEKTIRRDLGLLYTVAGLAARYSRDARRLRPVEVVGEFEKVLWDELDLQREAASASQLKRNFQGSPLLYVPEIEWPMTRRNVMVMERIHGIQISDMDALRAAGADLKVLSERGVEIFFTQVFRDSFFHADMHPGNIFVDASDPTHPRYMAVDFGIMGTLAPTDQRYLAENFLAFFRRDYRRVAELHVESGWVPTGTRVDEFESAIRTVCEPIFERPLKDISFGHLLLRLFQTARRFHMEVQPQLVLLQKTLLNIEGLGRQLYPDLDLWQTAKPFLERWMGEQVGVRGLLKKLRSELPRIGTQLPELPGLLHEALAQAGRTREEQARQARELARLRLELQRGQRRHFLAFSGASLIVCALLLAIFAPPWSAAPIPIMLGGLGLALIIAAWPSSGRP